MDFDEAIFFFLAASLVLAVICIIGTERFMKWLMGGYDER